MTQLEFESLQAGDIIKGWSGTSYIVTANYGDRVTAVKSVDVTNPDEWTLVLKKR